MKLTSLRVEQFRRFGEPFELSSLSDGLNVLHGPQEVGKSTLADAIRTLFVERHKTKGDSFAGTIVPRGRSDAAPHIRAGFSLDGIDCVAEKTFLQKPRASLTIGQESWSGDEADQELARRLGFELSGKGASRHDTRGIPGLLWIEQGSSQDLLAPVEHARQPLQDRLHEVIGSVTSGATNTVSTAVTKELKELRTATGRTTGKLAQCEEQLDQSLSEQATLQQKATEFRTHTDRLANDLSRQAELESSRPWVEVELKRQQCREDLDRLEPQLEKLAEADRTLSVLETRIDRFAEQRVRREQQLVELRRMDEELTDLASRSDQLAERVERAIDAERAADTALQAAMMAHRAAEGAEARRTLTEKAAQLDREIRRVQGLVDRVVKASDQIAVLKKSASVAELDSTKVARINALDAQLTKARIRREAIASRLNYRLLPGVSVDSQPWGALSGEGTELATEPATLRIEGVGEIEIIPGGADDARRLGDDIKGAEREMAALFSDLGVQNGEELASRITRHQSTLREVAELERDRLTLLDGQDLAEWQSQLATHEGEAEAVASRLSALPSTATDAPPVQEARRAREDADAHLQMTRADLDTRRTEAVDAKVAFTQQQGVVTATRRSVEGEEALREFVRWQEDARAAEAEKVAVLEKRSELQATLAGLDADQLTSDLDRYARSLQVIERERSDLRDSITRTRSVLETLGMDGIEEDLAKVTVSVERLQTRRAALVLRADALQLLLESLDRHQREVTQRLYAPLKDRIEHYLGMLFPGVAPSVLIEDLAPVRVTRDGDGQHGVDEFSFGTREQLGVLARFAYADLLAEAGQPTLIVLDDALVHSDDDRLSRMKRVIDDAAQRHQILLFTCHPERWRDAGANTMIELRSLSN